MSHVTELEKRLNELNEKLQILHAKRQEISQKINSYENEKKQLEIDYTLAKSKAQSSTKQWQESSFPWSEKLMFLLKNKFNFKEFRLKQLSAINATLSGRDVLLLMPTGGGKSLVYYLPALVNGNVTLVVSPLISLMEDQLIFLKKHDIEGATLHGGSSKEDKKSIQDSLVNSKSKLRLLYVSPEWVAKSKIFMKNLKKCYEMKRLDRIVIDEVHCCSTWGHDFRHDYNYLGFFKDMFPEVPLLGLTATATMQVLADIQKMLSLKDALIITAPFNRPNLFYKVEAKPQEKQEVFTYLTELLQNKFKGQSGIIYTSTIKETEEITTALRKNGLKVRNYHAQLEPDQRKLVHKKWLENDYQAVVATVAFGMGIDKSNVRFVIHFSIPKSLESLYQEAGRAGRDGEKAHCLLLYNLTDALRNICMAQSPREEKNCLAILEYCLNNSNCRRQLIAKYFEDDWDCRQCQEMCDNCVENNENHCYDVKSVLEDLLKIIGKALESDNKLTLNKLIAAYLQIGSKEFRVASLKTPKLTRTQAENIIGSLIMRKFLKIEKGYSMYTTFGYITAGKRSCTEKIEFNTCKRMVGLEKIHQEEPVSKKIKIG